MNPKPRIAVVEDDAPIRRLIVELLEREGFSALGCEDGQALDMLIAREPPDVVVLDVMLPGEDGLNICKRLTARAVAPVIMVSAKGEDIDRIVGLELGADDYLAKPFNPRELVARIRALLRRSRLGREIVQGEVLGFEGWRLHVGVRKLTNPRGEEVMLTGAEFDLLLTFLRNPQRVVTRTELLDAARGRSGASNLRTIDVQVCRLRRKLQANASAELIHAIRSVGYTLVARVSVLRAAP